jgi:hypothetical protein
LETPSQLNGAVKVKVFNPMVRVYVAAVNTVVKTGDWKVVKLVAVVFAILMETSAKFKVPAVS